MFYFLLFAFSPPLHSMHHPPFDAAACYSESGDTAGILVIFALPMNIEWKASGEAKSKHCYKAADPLSPEMGPALQLGGPTSNPEVQRGIRLQEPSG